MASQHCSNEQKKHPPKAHVKTQAKAPTKRSQQKGASYSEKRTPKTVPNGFPEAKTFGMCRPAVDKKGNLCLVAKEKPSKKERAEGVGFEGAPNPSR